MLLSVDIKNLSSSNINHELEMARQTEDRLFCMEIEGINR
jgi:hypothetical protein